MKYCNILFTIVETLFILRVIQVLPVQLILSILSNIYHIIIETKNYKKSINSAVAVESPSL